MRDTNGGSNRRWTRTYRGLVASGAALAAAACADPTGAGQTSATNAALSASLTSVPVGYGDLTSSYVGTGVADGGARGLWLGGGRDARMGGGALMGGGIQDAFVGGVGRGHGFGHEGPFGGAGCRGTFSAATGRVACETTTRNGLTVTRSAAYADAQGAVQQAFDSVTTNSVNLQTAVSGTVTFTADSASAGGDRGRRGGHGWGEGRGPGGRLLGDTATILSATTTVRSTSVRTVTGLAQGSTQRTANGTSAGEESTTGTSSRGAFTATRVVGDTTRGLVVPVQVNAQTYPTAGTVVRAMRATLTYSGQATAAVSRREVVTYDGSATAQISITENGVTKSCTRPLPRGSLTCQ